MSGFVRWICLTAVGIAGLSPAAALAEFWRANGKQGAVVAGGPGPEAASAGVAVLQEGGNAADATATMLLVLCVVDSGNFCFGGEVPILVYDSPRAVVEVVAGQGAAPRLATLDHFVQLGGIPSKGPELAAIPAAFDAILTLLDRYGTISLERAARPMLAILDAKSDDWCRDLARTMRELIHAEQQGGERRRGLRLAADHFYRGPIARRLDAWSQANGGLIRYVDLANHVTRVEEPATIDYRGHTVAKCGVWTQGPFLLQSLRLLEGFDVRALRADGADFVHLATEAMKLALADRDAYYADPLWEDVPLQPLLSRAYADLRRPLIDPRQASVELRPGDPVAGQARRAAPPGPVPADAATPRDTTTCLAADRFGNVVAATPSGWGGVLAGDTGIQLGSRLRSLNAWPGHPNHVEPGKRPRITLTPTLVLKDRRPVLAISVAGGDLQDQVTLQLLTDCVDFGLSSADAVTRPRFSTAHHIGSFNQTPPQLASLSINEEFGADTIDQLKSRGHRVQIAKPPIGHPCVLRIDPQSGELSAAGDPKARRHAAAY